jgi:hypothetical protein
MLWSFYKVSKKLQAPSPHFGIGDVFLKTELLCLKAIHTTELACRGEADEDSRVSSILADIRIALPSP